MNNQSLDGPTYNCCGGNLHLGHTNDCREEGLVKPTRLIIIESPYAGSIETNLAYLRRCIRDSLLRGEAPFASHQMYPGALDDGIPEERLKGILAGFAWWPSADWLAFYLDLGWSRGMRAALGRARSMGMEHAFRVLDGGQAEIEARLGELASPERRPTRGDAAEFYEEQREQILRDL